MNREQLNNHALRYTLDQLLDLLKDQSFGEYRAALAEAWRQKVDHIEAVLSHLRQLMQSTPAELVSEHGLNVLNNHMSPVADELAAFRTSGLLAHIDQAPA